MVYKMPALEGTPREAGSGPRRLREPSEISCSGALGSAAALERGEWGRLYPRQGISGVQPVGASSGLRGHVQSTPGGNSCLPRPERCRHLPSCKGLNGGFLLPTPAAGIRPALLPSLLRPCSPAEIPGAGFVAAAFAAPREVPAPQNHGSRGNACKQDGAGPAARNPPFCQGLWVWERPKRGAQDVGDGSAPTRAAGLPRGDGVSLSRDVRAAPEAPGLSHEQGVKSRKETPEAWCLLELRCFPQDSMGGPGKPERHPALLLLV